MTNDNPFTMTKVVPYVTIDDSNGGILEPPPEEHAYLNPQANSISVKEDQLCWATQGGDKNPVRIDIYSSEKKSLFLGEFTSEYIQIFFGRCKSPSRVFLKPQQYSGVLKLVCADCRAKEFRFIIDPKEFQPLKFA